MGGRPKGLELVGGVRIIDRVVSSISAVTPVTMLAANDPMAHNWLENVAIVPDVFAGTGGLAGIHAALQKGGDIIAIAWDMPFVAPELVAAIVDRAISSGATAVIPESTAPSGMEPFCAFYAASSLHAIEQFLKAGGGPAHRFLAQMHGVVHLPLAQVSSFGPVDRLFFSVNTPADLMRARAIADGPQ